MERLLRQRGSFLKRALNSLDVTVIRIKKISPGDPDYLVIRDSMIKRFEYSIDTFWKFLKAYLETTYGVETLSSPKAVIKQAIELGVISELHKEQLLNMIDDRNMTSHAYNEEIAIDIASAIPKHNELLHTLTDQLSAIED